MIGLPLENKRSELDYSIRLSKSTLEKLKGSKNTHEKVVNDIESMKRSVAEASSEIEEVKGSIEKLFLDHYSKSIKIIGS